MTTFEVAVGEILRAAVDAGAFPGAVAFVARGDDVLFHGALGTLGEDSFDRPATTSTVYDLASLTKLVVAALALKVLRAHGEPLDAPLRRFLPDFSDQITLRHLLSHTSGLKRHLQTLSDQEATDWLSQIARWPLETTPGTEVLYNCTNSFLLGCALVELEKTPLETLVRAWILEPARLAMKFAPDDLGNVAPTEQLPNGTTLHGEVHDPAARSFHRQTGDCAGNAGLFATAEAVASFARLWHAEAEFFHPDDLKAAFSPHASEGDGFRALAWQLDRRFYMGEHAPRGTAGHLGFTGPSLVWNPSSKTVVAVLNNRVHPHTERPNRLPFHAAIADEVWKEFYKPEA